MSQPTVIRIWSLAVLGFGTLVASAANAAGTAPPAEASAGGISAGTGAAIPQRTLAYEPIAPGMLARTLFATTQTGPITVEMVDILVGPGQTAQLPAMQFAALLDIEAGTALLSLDGKAVAAKLGSVISVNQGQSIGVDNRRGGRAFVARLIKLSAAGR